MSQIIENSSLGDPGALAVFSLHPLCFLEQRMGHAGRNPMEGWSLVKLDVRDSNVEGGHGEWFHLYDFEIQREELAHVRNSRHGCPRPTLWVHRGEWNLDVRPIGREGDGDLKGVAARAENPALDADVASAGIDRRAPGARAVVVHIDRELLCHSAKRLSPKLDARPTGCVEG